MVILEEFRGLDSGMAWENLLQLCDEGGIYIEIKGSNMFVSPRVVIMTSNFMPENWGYVGMPLEALYRRITAFHWHRRDLDPKVWSNPMPFVNYEWFHAHPDGPASRVAQANLGQRALDP